MKPFTVDAKGLKSRAHVFFGKLVRLTTHFDRVKKFFSNYIRHRFVLDRAPFEKILSFIGNRILFFHRCTPIILLYTVFYPTSVEIP